MQDVIVTGFSHVPPFAQGLIRDLRVRWALEEIGQRYESLLIDLPDKDDPANRARHPFGLVPAFEADGAPLFESGAILYRIARTSDTLMPDDTIGRDQTLMWMFAALSTVEPPLIELFAVDIPKSAEDWAVLRRPSALQAARKRIQALGVWLENRDHLTGRFTVADILMTTVLRFVRHADLLTESPAVQAYVERCQDRPAFKRALARQLAEYAGKEPAIS